MVAQQLWRVQVPGVVSYSREAFVLLVEPLVLLEVSGQMECVRLTFHQ